MWNYLWLSLLSFFTSDLFTSPGYFNPLLFFPIHSHCYCFGSAIIISQVDYHNRFLISPCFQEIPLIRPPHYSLSNLTTCLSLKPFGISAAHRTNSRLLGRVWNAFHYFTHHNFPSVSFSTPWLLFHATPLHVPATLSQLFLKMPFSMPLHVLFGQPIIFLLPGEILLILQSPAQMSPLWESLPWEVPRSLLLGLCNNYTFYRLLSLHLKDCSVIIYASLPSHQLWTPQEFTVVLFSSSCFLSPATAANVPGTWLVFNKYLMSKWIKGWTN